MIGCRDLREALARGPDETIGPDADAHLAACQTCREHVAAHDRIMTALRAEPEPIDDFTRTRLLATLTPKLDEIARHHVPRRVARSWIAIVAAGAMAAAVVLWLGRGHSPEQRTPAVTVTVDLERLRPYVISGVRTESGAATLLAGRFSVLEVGPGELVRATAGDRDVRIAAVGPARIEVERAKQDAIDLATAGIVLVDARSTRAIGLRSGTIRVRAINATFAVQTQGAATVVFVERGELELGASRLHAGEWYGPAEARSLAIVSMLRDHVHASAPPLDHNGILAIDGSSRAVTESGAVLGAAPLWARVPAGELVLVLGGPSDRRIPIEIREGSITHVSGETIAELPAPTIEKSPPRADKHVVAPTPAPKAEIAPPVVAVVEDAGPKPPDVPTASQLYARAESALRAGDRSTAEATWTHLVASFSDSPQAASALYDLAGLARARGDRDRARAYLAKLVAGSTSTALREPAHYLSCRLDVESKELVAAASCFTSFRVAFPRSSHDDEVLAWLAGRAEESGGCAAARSLADEYLLRYPRGLFAARARRCEAAP